MIDFRYLLTTIVAIFLALAVGILIGSALFPAAEDLDRQVQDKIKENVQLNNEIDDLENLGDAQEEFGREVAGRWIDGMLANTEVVLFRFEGTDEGLVERTREAIELAGASIPTTITLTDRMAMDDEELVETMRAELADLGIDDEEVGVGVARALGRAAAADATETGEENFPSVQEIAEGQSVIEVDADDAESPIPTRADFVVLGGATGDPSYDIDPIAEALLTELGGSTTEVVAAEGWQSEWAMVPALRRTEVRDLAATVDHGDTSPGVISTVVELSRFIDGEPGHYGFREGADAVAPDNPGG